MTSTPATSGATLDIQAAMAALNAMSSNGVIRCGLNVDADNLSNRLCKLPYDEKKSHEELIANLFITPGTSPKACAIMVAAALIVMNLKNIREPEMCRKIEDIQGGEPVTSQMGAEAVEHMQTALTLMVAGKISWYQTGHHTGQSYNKATGYAAKIMDAVGLSSDVPANVTVVHTISHWIRTSVVLKSIGVTGFDAEVPVIKMTVGDEIAKRAASNPAGTAAPCDVVVGASMFLNSAYIAAFSVDDIREAVRLAQWMQEANKNWIKYHIGYKGLTGHDRIAPPEVSDSLGSAVITLLKAKTPDSTITKAPSLAKFGISPAVQSQIPAINRAMKAASVEVLIAQHKYIHRAALEGIDPTEADQAASRIDLATKKKTLRGGESDDEA